MLDAIYAALQKVGPTLAAPTSSVAISLRKSCFWPGSSPNFCRRNPRPWAFSRSCFTRRPGVAPGARQGDYVPLAEQDPALWDSQMIDEAEALLRARSALGTIGRYQLEGALQSAHVHRCRTGHANWAAVVQLYDALLRFLAHRWSRSIARWPSPKCMAPAPVSPRCKQIAADPRLAEYQPYWAARAELLARTGAHAEARQAYDIAIGLERDRRPPLPAAAPVRP